MKIYSYYVDPDRALAIVRIKHADNYRTSVIIVTIISSHLPKSRISDTARHRRPLRITMTDLRAPIAVIPIRVRTYFLTFLATDGVSTVFVFAMREASDLPRQ